MVVFMRITSVKCSTWPLRAARTSITFWINVSESMLRTPRRGLAWRLEILGCYNKLYIHYVICVFVWNVGIIMCWKCQHGSMWSCYNRINSLVNEMELAPRRFECRDYLVYVPSRSETNLQCNIVSHWLGPFAKWSLWMKFQTSKHSSWF